MTESAFPRAPSHLVRRGVRILLRGGKTLEGLIHIPEGMPLLDFLRAKRFFLNLTSVKMDAAGEDAPIEHLSLRLSNVVWVIPLEGALHVSSSVGPVADKRAVELQLVDNHTLTVSLQIAQEQRMSDYLDANLGFLPLWSAVLPSTGQHLERLAVNHDAILAIREMVPR